MLVSVVIPVKDDVRVSNCLASIRANRPDGDQLEILVVDNNSVPDFSNWLQSLQPAAAVIAETGLGAYGARNAGIERAAGDVVMFTDADCTVRPDWIASALAALVETKADIVQGFSGNAEPPIKIARLIQQRYAARFRSLRFGEGTECDTRNLAVRREVFERIRFNPDYRRVGDTEFGLKAESMGFRVAYSSEMYVAHSHDEALDVFVAKQVCHGWGAQRLNVFDPKITWRGAYLRPRTRITPAVGRLPGVRGFGRGLASASIVAARGLQAVHRPAPGFIASAALAVLDKIALLGGQLMFYPESPEPSVSELLGRQVLRD